MSELINNSEKRKELLKHVILQIHEGHAPEELKPRLMDLMKKIPYGEIVEVEQELIAEGLPEEEILKLCDAHTQVLDGLIDLTFAKAIPAGHPVDTFKKENEELLKVADKLHHLFKNVEHLENNEQINQLILQMKGLFNNLMDVEKHYVRKENLLFPFLEKAGITGPPKVMWGKHDQTREFLKNALEALNISTEYSKDDLSGIIDIVLKPAVQAVADMTMKENEILLPMCMDKLTDVDWYEIYQQTNEIGYCLYDPEVEWKPDGIEIVEDTNAQEDLIRLPSGSFTPKELLAILNTVPFDMTFVDKNDKVKYFSQGSERIFTRNRAILQRDVRMCHPPSSVNIVDKIIEDFRNGKEDSAPFWINMGGEKFIHIEYFALRDENGEYLGTLEVSQDLTEKRTLEGEQRLLNYGKK